MKLLLDILLGKTKYKMGEGTQTKEPENTCVITSDYKSAIEWWFNTTKPDKLKASELIRFLEGNRIIK